MFVVDKGFLVPLSFFGWADNWRMELYFAINTPKKAPKILNLDFSFSETGWLEKGQVDGLTI